MNLTVIEQKTIENLPVNVRPVVEARLAKPLKLYQDYDLEAEIIELIIVAHFEKGITVEGKDKLVTTMKNTLLKDLRAPKFETVSMKLIRLFISNGIRGQYGTFKNQLNTVCIENIFYWINKGLESEDYKRSVTEFNKKLAEQEYKPKVYDQMTTMEAIKNSFERYKLTSEMPLCSFAYHDILNDLNGVEYKGRKTLVPDFEARKRIILECEGQIETELKPQKEKAEKRGDLAKAESIARAIVGEGNTLPNLKKKAFLKYYFDELVRTNQELKLKSSGL